VQMLKVLFLHCRTSFPCSLCTSDDILYFPTRLPMCSISLVPMFTSSLIVTTRLSSTQTDPALLQQPRLASNFFPYQVSSDEENKIVSLLPPTITRFQEREKKLHVYMASVVYKGMQCDVGKGKSFLS